MDIRTCLQRRHGVKGPQPHLEQEGPEPLPLADSCRPAINKPPPFKGRNFRMPIINPIQGGGLLSRGLHQGNDLGRPPVLAAGSTSPSTGPPSWVSLRHRGRVECPGKGRWTMKSQADLRKGLSGTYCFHEFGVPCGVV